ncbi:MAG: 50S ribosomal protein L34e [Candidatus Heimdallarchaeota archaeon]|nr:50S ribosomal protein L34e [Candidatus Heimdallarchaeota archaeon]
MVRKSIRSGKRILVKTPGGRFYFKSVKNKPNYPHCATCSRKLPGVARGTRVQVRRMSISQRRPNRPYGGQLCSPCLREKLVAANRVSS